MSIWRANGLLQILKFSENVKSRGRDQVRNENGFLKQSENFPFSFYLFKNALKHQKGSVFSR